MVNVRRYAKKAKKAVKRRYFKGGKYRKPNVYRMARDISLLRGAINSEKKEFQVSSGASWYKVGQVDGNNSGHFIVGFTPNIPTGTNYNQKIGRQCKLVSFHMDLQLYAQNSAISGNKFTLEIWNIEGQYGGSLTDFMQDVYTGNPFVTGQSQTIYDNTSNRQVASFKGYRCVYRKQLYLQSEEIEGQVAVRNFNLGKKYGKNGHMLHWANDGTTVTTGYQVMVLRADSGNASTTTGSTISGIPINGINTGTWLKYQVSHYYIDN